MPGRSGEQLSRTPGEWKDHQALERRRTREALERDLAAARARGEEWIAWIDAGCPELTPEEYEATRAPGARPSRRGRQQPSS